MFQKREQAFPVLQQPFRCFGHVVISAVGLCFRQLAMRARIGSCFADKRMPVDLALLEGMPDPERTASLGEHPFSESHRIRATT